VPRIGVEEACAFRPPSGYGGCERGPAPTERASSPPPAALHTGASRSWQRQTRVEPDSGVHLDPTPDVFIVGIRLQTAARRHPAQEVNGAKWQEAIS
jgi:hypothetical protein